MALFGKNKGGAHSVNFMMVDGIPSISQGTAVSVTLADSGIEIRQRLGKAAPALLSYAQITRAAGVNETEIKEADKSVIGRAFVGGVLLGPLGAVVGGMSGIGKKEKSQDKTYFVINYTAAGSDEPRVLSFEIVGATIGFRPFLTELKEKSGIADAPAVRGDAPTIL